MKKLMMVTMMVLMAMTIVFGVNHTTSAKMKYSKGVTVASHYGKSQKKKAKEIEKKIRKKYGKGTYLKAGSDATWNKLGKRKQYYKKNHKFYVTYTVGKAIKTRKSGYGVDGIDLYEQSEYNYIGYPTGTKEGTLVLSYFVYCDHCNEFDDIVARYDVVLRNGK